MGPAIEYNTVFALWVIHFIDTFTKNKNMYLMKKIPYTNVYQRLDQTKLNSIDGLLRDFNMLTSVANLYSLAFFKCICLELLKICLQLHPSDGGLQSVLSKV